ncbi:MAG: GNAT family N-acetyltransferase [Betaproteobacteria bacterium]
MANKAALDIRPLRETDSLEDLTLLLHRAYASLAAAGLNYTAADQGIETTRKRVANGHCFVALDEGTVVGTILANGQLPNHLGTFVGRPNAASLHQFAVEPRLQGSGVGSLLLETAEEWAAQQRFAEMLLDIAEPATRLISFYHRRGYRAIGTVQWDGKTYRSVVMAKQLRA